jgi:hypothetical protein
MNKLLLAISATFLLNSTMAQAAVETFNFTFSGEEYSNTAIATGFISFDPANYLFGDSFGVLPEQYIVDFGLTLSRTGYVDGIFDKTSFTYIDLVSLGSLDFSRELIGQTVGASTFGQLTSPGATNSGFMLTGNSNLVSFDGYQIYAYDSGSAMKLTSFAPASIAAPVPEADTSAMLLTGLGVIGFMARRRKNT